jgi:hypothetical protein
VQTYADVVLMELVNVPKFLGAHTREPIPWPAQRPGGLPLLGNFFYEPTVTYPNYISNHELRQRLHFSVGPDRSVASVSLACVVCCLGVCD